MKVSIFTPTHNSKHLLEAYESIKNQNFDEWVIVYNNKANHLHLSEKFSDTRIKEITTEIVNGVGYYKRFACSNCTGDILIELDHDDLLIEGAIDKIKQAFEDNPKVGFVYSNDLVCNMNFSNRTRWNADQGWLYRETKYKDKIIDEPISFEATPASVSRIWYAPDHVRCFRKTVYDAVGGYNPELFILDDLDLMCRIFIAADFYFINEALYVYRVNENSTWLRHNADIQKGVWPIYYKYIEHMMMAWAERKGLLVLDLGGRFNKPEGYTSVDYKDADINFDLNSTWQLGDNTVGLIRAYDIFEHLRDPIYTMKELYRVLAPGGYALVRVPSTEGRGAFQDPTHKSFWNENSFLYYTHRDLAKYIDMPVRFQAIQCYTTQMDDKRNCWAVAHLMKLTDERVPGIVNI